MRLIYNSDAQRLQKNFDDKTPITVSELFRSERTASVPIELFLIDNDGGYATPGTSDYEVLIGRQAQAITTGKLTLTFTGTTEEIDLSKPKLATRIEAALNAVSEVNAAGGVDVVELKNGRAFQITFRSVGSRAAITAGVKDSMQPASVIISEVTAGTGSTREVQLLTLEEASLAEISTSGWSANSNPALAISTLVEGTANTREVVQLSVTGDPAPGSFFVVSNSEPISTEATAAQVKTILNSALSSDIGSVKKTGERIWQITYKTNGDKTALSAGTHNLVKRPSVTGTLSLNTTALAYAANSDGSDLSVGFTLKKSNEVLLSENVDLAEPFAEVIGSSAMLNNDSLGALFTIGGDDVNKGTAISLSGGLTYSSDTLGVPLANYLPLAGGTMTGNALFGNDVKVRFGSEPNLEIYSTGSASYIKDIGTGSLYLSGGGSVYIQSPAGETMAKFQGNGSCDFYYDNQKKLETTDLGCTISGKLIVNGNLDVSGTTTTFNSTVVTVDDPVFTVGGDTAPGSDDNKDRGIEFRYYSGSAKVGFFGYDDSEDAFTFLTDATNNSEVFSGTLGNLKVGNVLHGDGSASAPSFTFYGDTNSGIFGGTDIIGFTTGGTEAARFDSSGNLGIGGTPSEKLTVDGNVRINGDNKELYFSGNQAKFRTSSASSDVIFQTGTTELFRLDGSASTIHIPNDIQLRLGGGSDIRIVSESSQNVFSFYNHDTLFRTLTDDIDIIFKTTTGGTTSEIMRLDGSAKTIRIQDNVYLQIGTSSDLGIVFNGSDSIISGVTGDIKLQNYADDKDIIFEASAGSASPTELLRLDGSASSINVPDDIKLKFGDDGDLEIYSSSGGEAAQYDHRNHDVFFRTLTNDKNIIFQTRTSDAQVEMMRFDGSTSNVGIGTSGVAIDQKLHVKGNAIRLEESGGSSRHIDIMPAVSGVNHRFTSDSTSAGYNFENNGGVLAEIKGTGDLELYTDDKGLILSSANGTRYRITVANDGTVTSTAA